MFKKGLVFLGLFFVFNFSFAAYLKNIPQTITQPNGKKIQCFASGDHYHNWLHDSAGYTIIINENTGYYTYAIKKDGELISSNYIVGEVNPELCKLTKNINISNEKWLELRNELMTPVSGKPISKSVKKNHGHINNLVFFIRFSDENKFKTNTYKTIENKMNDSSSTDANSLYNYYRHVSYGNLFVTSHLYPKSDTTIIYSYQDIHPRKYYLAYNATSNPNGYKNSDERRNREHDLLKRTILFFQDSIPTDLNLDYNGDGRVDNVVFVTSGGPEGWSGLMWPHRWSLYSHNVSINGKRVYDYNFIMEEYMYSGIIAHEFMHSLGAPDLYRYDKNFDHITPIGNWDLMASTTYSMPQGLGAYMKYKYGKWIDSIPTIYSSGTYTLYPANGDSKENIAYKIPIDGEEHQYFVLEYRKKTSCVFESSLSGSGIVIYRIDERFNGNANYNGTNIFDEIYIFRPNGTMDKQGSLSLAYYSEEALRTNFNSNTNPYPFLSDGTTIKGINISNITRAIDSIRFTIGLDTTTLTLDTNRFVFENDLNHVDTFRITSNDSWHILYDSAWIIVSETQGVGDKEIYVRPKQLNSLTLNYSTELSVIGTAKIRTVNISLRPSKIDTCLAVSNLFESDTLVEIAFPLNDSSLYFNSASEYFSIFNAMLIDSISIYFGNVSFSPNDSITIRVTNSTALKYPTNLLKRFTFPAHTITPNEWNTFVLEGQYRVNRHFCIDYILPYQFNSSDSSRFVFSKNRTLRNESLSTAFLKNGTTWEPVKNILNDNTDYSSPIQVFLCPVELAINDSPFSEDNIKIKLYPNPAKDQINIEIKGFNSKVDFQIYSISGQLLHTQSNINVSNTYSIPIGSLSSGMYLLRVNSSTFSKVKTFIIE